MLTFMAVKSQGKELTIKMFISGISNLKINPYLQFTVWGPLSFPINIIIGQISPSLLF